MNKDEIRYRVMPTARDSCLALRVGSQGQEVSVPGGGEYDVRHAGGAACTNVCRRPTRRPAWSPPRRHLEPHPASRTIVLVAASHTHSTGHLHRTYAYGRAAAVRVAAKVLCQDGRERGGRHGHTERRHWHLQRHARARGARDAVHHQPRPRVGSDRRKQGPAGGGHVGGEDERARAVIRPGPKARVQRRVACPTLLLSRWRVACGGACFVRRRQASREQRRVG